MSLIRLAQAFDVPALHAMLRELAAFEGGAVDSSPDDLLRDGFGPQPLFQALVAEGEGEGEADALVGMLIFFPTYSSWAGKPALMIHDLFVRESGRGKGVGKGLVRALGRIAAERGCCRVEVNVLQSNASARGFYQSLGLLQRHGWLIQRGFP